MEATPINNWATYGQATGADAVLERCSEIEVLLSLTSMSEQRPVRERLPYFITSSLLLSSLELSDTQSI